MDTKVLIIMKNRLFIREPKRNKRCLGTIIVTAVTVVLFALCPPKGWSMEYSGIRNPIGPSTVPPSSMRSGLIPTPDPIDTSGNLVITGNVRRGRHFRGTVPYQSTTSFRAALGSMSLQSFLRDSAGTQDFGSYASQYGSQPYYSPTETVTTTRPGRSGVFVPGDTRISSRAPDVFGLEPLPKRQALPGWDTSASDIRLQELQTPYSAFGQPWSISLSPQEMERMVRSGVAIDQRGEQLVPAEGIARQYQDEIELLRRNLNQMRDKAAKLQQSLIEKDESLRLSTKAEPSEGVWPAEDRLDVQPPLETPQIAKEHKKGRFLTGQAPEEQTKDATTWRSVLAQDRFYPYESKTGEEFTRRTGTALRQGPILSEPQKKQYVTFKEQLQKAAKWGEPEPKASEEIAEPAKREKGRLGTLTPTWMQEQPDEFPPHQLSRQRGHKAPGTSDLSPTGNWGGVKKRVWGPDTYEQIKEQIDNLVKREARSATEDTRYSLLPRSGVPSRDTRGLEKAGVPAEPEEAVDSETEPGEDELFFETLREIRTQESSRTRSSVLDELDELSAAELSGRAKRIMGRHKSLESFAGAKFNQHIQAAEGYLRAGRYYQAAEAFAVASIYKLDDPVAYAGKGHALFAAGEYMSSALFLARALEIAPEYAQIKIDLVAVLGDRARIESRIADIKKWLERSDAVELKFLLGYVYYRMGRLQLARQAIEAAFEKMPKSSAVGTVKKAIDAAIPNQ